LNNDQLGFEFLPELPVSQVAPKKRAARASALSPKSVGQASAGSVNTSSDVEALAQALEAHPDYRVQRRLKPCLDWPGTALQGVAKVVVLDTETTGLDAGREKIIELALVRVDVDVTTGLPVGGVKVYDGLEDPGKPIPKEVVALTGIRDADVRGQRLDEGRIAELLDGVDLVIAHNAGFDRPFAESRIAQFAHIPWACSFADIDWKAQGRSSAKLESLAQALGWFYDAHRAEMDCHALLTVLAAKLPTQAHTGLSHVMRAAQHPSFRLQATHAPFDAKDLLKARGYRWNVEKKVWHTVLPDEATLEAECDWLRVHAYHERSAAIQIEKLDALVKYSARAGELMYRQL
jgi:DNA polymerase-3 subunit epsilon